MNHHANKNVTYQNHHGVIFEVPYGFTFRNRTVYPARAYYAGAGRYTRTGVFYGSVLGPGNRVNSRHSFFTSMRTKTEKIPLNRLLYVKILVDFGLSLFNIDDVEWDEIEKTLQGPVEEFKKNGISRNNPLPFVCSQIEEDLPETEIEPDELDEPGTAIGAPGNGLLEHMFENTCVNLTGTAFGPFCTGLGVVPTEEKPVLEPDTVYLAWVSRRLGVIPDLGFLETSEKGNMEAIRLFSGNRYRDFLDYQYIHILRKVTDLKERQSMLNSRPALDLLPEIDPQSILAPGIPPGWEAVKKDDSIYDGEQPYYWDAFGSTFRWTPLPPGFLREKADQSGHPYTVIRMKSTTPTKG